MDTKQKNREEEAARPARKKPVNAPPPSAQQRNGAARTAREQQTATRKRSQEEKTDPRKREAADSKEAPRKREAAAQKEQPRRREASGTKQTAAAAKKKKPLFSLFSSGKASGKASGKGAKADKTAKPEEPVKKKRQPPKETEKRRRYGNSKPKKSPVASISEIYKQYAGSDDAEGGTAPKAARPLVPTPPVIYTEPKTFNRNRLLVQLATVTAVVAAVVMGISVFFKVEEIRISGEEVYRGEMVEKASGIQIGDGLLTFSRPRAGALIKANLPYVDTVRFGIKLPGTVNIIIEEDAVVYSIKDQNGQWWLTNSDGRVVKQAEGNEHADHTQILGVTLESPVPNTIGVATEAVPTQTNADGELMPVTTENAKKLDVAREILRELEANDIVGSAASVDVSRLEDIILWYGSRYQVNLGDDSNMAYKISCMNEVIHELNDYQSGILDISFTIWPTQVGYTPFS